MTDSPPKILADVLRRLMAEKTELEQQLVRVTLRCTGLADELVRERKRHASYFVEPLGDVFAERDRLRSELGRVRAALCAVPASLQAGQPKEGELALWEQAEWNTIREILCRAHPAGADAIDAFVAWWENDKKQWLGPHRACGAWLAGELRRLGHGSQDLVDAIDLLRTIPASVIYVGDWTRRCDALLAKHGGA